MGSIAGVRQRMALALVLAVSSVAVVGTTSPVAADHEAPAAGATLAGSLQSELGCGGGLGPGMCGHGAGAAP